MTGFHMTALAEVHRAQLQRQADRCRQLRPVERRSQLRPKLARRHRVLRRHRPSLCPT